MDGDTVDVTEKYQESMVAKQREKTIEQKIKEKEEKKKQEDKKDKSIRIVKVETDKKEYKLYEDIEITITLENNKKINKYGAGILILNSKSELVTAMNTVRLEKYLDETVQKVHFKIKRNCLNEDRYYLTISICDEKVMFSYDKEEYATSFDVKVPKNSFGVPMSEGIYACEYEVNQE